MPRCLRFASLVSSAAVVLVIASCIAAPTPPRPVTASTNPAPEGGAALPTPGLREVTTTTPGMSPTRAAAATTSASPQSQPVAQTVSLHYVPEPSAQPEVPSPFRLPSNGLTHVAFVPRMNNGYTLGDIDLLELGNRVYAVQNHNVAGFMVTDVTDVPQPVVLGAWRLEPMGAGEHITVFRQGDRGYVVLPLETPPVCGLAFVDITDLQHPTFHSLRNSATVGATPPGAVCTPLRS